MTWYRIAVGLLVGASSVAGAQSTLVGRITAQGSGEPMAYAVVGLPGMAIERFANDSGLFYFGNLPAGSLALRVRRLGYLPVDTVVATGPEQRDTIRIELTRVAMSLADITVRVHPPCRTPGIPVGGKDSTLRTILNQVRMNAEQYRFLVKQYPFYYLSEIIRSSRVKKDGETRIDSREIRRQDARADSKYQPGKVLAKRGAVVAFQIPSLVDFADPDFVGNHCFHLRGTEVVEGEALIRVDVVAAERLRNPDVDGAIYLDPGSFQVLRTTLRLSKISRDVDYLSDFEVTTVFREIMPSIPVIASISSVQTINPLKLMPIDMAWETFKLAGYQFLRKKPGDDVRRTP